MAIATYLVYRNTHTRKRRINEMENGVECGGSQRRGKANSFLSESIEAFSQKGEEEEEKKTFFCFLSS